MKKLAILFVSFVLITACKSNKKTELDITSFAIVNGPGEQGLKVTSQGDLYFGENKVATISKDGQITGIKKGQTIATYTNDTLYFNDAQKQRVHIDGKGVIYDDGSKKMWWNKDGDLLRNDTATGFSMKPVQPAAYLLASIVYVISTTPIE